MIKITIDELRAGIAADEEAALRARDAESHGINEHRRAEVHATLGGVSALLGIAWLDAVLEGVPERIHLSLKNGFMKGIYLQRHAGRWRFHWSLNSGDNHRINDKTLWTVSYFAPAVLGAMNIPYSPQAQARLTQIGSLPFPGDVRSFLEAIVERVPKDAMRAGAGYAEAILSRHIDSSLVLLDDREAHVTAWSSHLRDWIAYVAAEMRLDLAEPLPGSKPSPVAIAARGGYLKTLKAMKEQGVEMDRATPFAYGDLRSMLTPLHRRMPTDATPAFHALSGAKWGAARYLLDEAGADATTREPGYSETLFHAIANGVDTVATHPPVDEVRQLALLLADRGCDPAARNVLGETASQVVLRNMEANATLERSERKLDRHAVAWLREIAEILEDPIGHSSMLVQ